MGVFDVLKKFFVPPVIGQGKNLVDGIRKKKPIKEIVKGHVKSTIPTDSIKETAKAVSDAHHSLLNVAIKIGESIAGEPGGVLMEVATGSNRIQTEVALTGISRAADAVGELDAGEFFDPVNLAAVPLAAAIRAAAKQYEPVAAALPDGVKSAMAAHFSTEILANTRYVVSSLEISLPSGLNFFKGIGGTDRHAVAVDNIIAFSEEPGETHSALHWWAHELVHMEQYASWGVDEFAKRYVTAFAEIEHQADAKANSVVPA